MRKGFGMIRYCCNSLRNETHDCDCPRRSVVGENIDEHDWTENSEGILMCSQCGMKGYNDHTNHI